MEAHGVNADGRIYLGDASHPCPYLPRTNLHPFSIRFPDKIWHGMVAFYLALWVGPLWAFLITTIVLEVVFPFLYDRNYMKFGIWDTFSHAVGCLLTWGIQ